VTTLFLSDLHLGHPRCRASELLDFLDIWRDADVYLVGDIFDDLLAQWPQEHFDVINKLLNFKHIVYLPGNHDNYFRRVLIGSSRLTVTEETYYLSSNGRRYLVAHGDVFDPSMWSGNGPRWIRRLIYFFGMDVHPRAITSRVEGNAIVAAKSLGLDGVICGHTHTPVKKSIDGIDYVNCGDWLWHSTAVVDRGNGMELISNELPV
jgi:UDP-2,3-diacylglucosamine pyrophosphatase LpxH